MCQAVSVRAADREEAAHQRRGPGRVCIELTASPGSVPAPDRARAGLVHRGYVGAVFHQHVHQTELRQR